MSKQRWDGHRRNSALPVLLAAVPVAVVCGLGAMALSDWIFSGSGSGSDEAAGQRPTTTAAGPPRVFVTDHGYEPGDCITYEVDPDDEVADPQVVPCDRDHRMQVTGRVDLDLVTHGYPGLGEWAAVIDERCEPEAEDFLGHPLDPYGQFTATALYPTEDGWAHGDRAGMWCGIGWAGPAHGWGALSSAITRPPPFAADTRTSEPGYHHPVGSCLDSWATVTEPLVVDCARPHTLEVVGEVDLSGQSGPPTGDRLTTLINDCHERARDYLGADPVAPWESGYEPLSDETWAAGTRRSHCFVGQWDENAAAIEITGSAKS